ncbi:MAG TPA: hypothetical protein VFJ51_11740 [Nitrososphaeraceae archaeon]|nr:hypothetical protein [Nitrososphaeraceae archaeon]
MKLQIWAILLIFQFITGDFYACETAISDAVDDITNNQFRKGTSLNHNLTQVGT